MAATKTETYLWSGKSPKGEVLSGEYEATDRKQVGEYLRKRRITITAIKKKPTEVSLGFLKKKGVGVKDLCVFTRQFATMVNAGLPLVQCLDVLARRGINLNKIESRPDRKKPWHYLFYLDFEGDAADPNVVKALEELKTHTEFIRELGSYPTRTLGNHA